VGGWGEEAEAYHKSQMLDPRPQSPTSPLPLQMCGIIGLGKDVASRHKEPFAGKFLKMHNDSVRVISAWIDDPTCMIFLFHLSLWSTAGQESHGKLDPTHRRYQKSLAEWGLNLDGTRSLGGYEAW